MGVLYNKGFYGVLYDYVYYSEVSAILQEAHSPHYRGHFVSYAILTNKIIYMDYCCEDVKCFIKSNLCHANLYHMSYHFT